AASQTIALPRRFAASEGRPSAGLPHGCGRSGEALAHRSAKREGGRKVRTPQGSAPGNARSGQPEGQWHRKHTALLRRFAASEGRPLQGLPTVACSAKVGKGEKVR